MTVDFWTNSNFIEFWGYVKMLLTTVSPGVMLVVGLAAAGLLLGIIIKIYHETQKDDEKNDDDYEIKHY